MAVPPNPRREFSFPGRPTDHAVSSWPPRPQAEPLAGDEDFDQLLAKLRELGSPAPCPSTPSPLPWTRARGHHPGSVGSSPSRAQAIDGYRREMLDLVHGLPEEAYELSLRDIVEPPSPPPRAGHIDTDQEDNKDTNAKKQSKAKKPKKQSMDMGLLIKMLRPLSMGGKKKVLPNPGAKDAKKGKGKEVQEEERWRKGDLSEAGSHSSTSSSNGKGPRRRRKGPGCYAFFGSKKSKNGSS